MTTSKIDRSQVVAQLQRLQGPQGTAQTPGTVKVEEVVAKSEPDNIFGARSKHNDRPSGEGEAVSTTASASKLWGQAAVEGSKPPLAALTLKNLTPEQAKAKYAELEKKKAGLETRIEGRANELDRRWEYTRLKTRTEALKKYLAESPNLPPAQRAELQAAIEKSEGVQAQIDGLMGDVKKLRKEPGMKKAGTPEERHALAVKIMEARRAHSTAVKEATEAVDKAGLKIERLAMTEDVIDPSGGATSQYGSMVGLMGQYFETSFMMNTLHQLYFGPMAAFVKELDREAAEGAKRRQIEDDWRARDDFQRQLLKELDQKRLVQKGTVEAVKTRNVAKMSAGDVTKMHHESKK